MHLLTRRLWVPLALAALASLGLSPVRAQDFPDNKPIKLIVPFAPGGPTDILARIVATGLGKALGTSVVVDNKAGGGGLIGAQAAAQATADGYTLLFAGDGQLTLLPQLFPKSGFAPDRQLVPIRLVAGQANVLMANTSAGIGSVASLIERAKARPGELSYGSAGNGTPSQLIGSLFENSTGTRMLHVAYRGAGPAMADLLGGQINLMFVGEPVARQQASNPQLKALAITGGKRSANLRDVPTFAETGVSGLGDETGVWWAVMAPGGIPPKAQSKLATGMRNALADPEVRRALQVAGVDLLDKDAATVGQWIQRDHARWAALIKAGKIKVD